MPRNSILSLLSEFTARTEKIEFSWYFSNFWKALRQLQRFPSHVIARVLNRGVDRGEQTATHTQISSISCRFVTRFTPENKTESWSATFNSTGTVHRSNFPAATLVQRIQDIWSCFQPISWKTTEMRYAHKHLTSNIKRELQNKYATTLENEPTLCVKKTLSCTDCVTKMTAAEQHRQMPKTCCAFVKSVTLFEGKLKLRIFCNGQQLSCFRSGGKPWEPGNASNAPLLPSHKSEIKLQQARFNFDHTVLTNAGSFLRIVPGFRKRNRQHSCMMVVQDRTQLRDRKRDIF